ncbi:MAG TPA: hypothetical protein VHE61_23605 [Opitutaceae bacterium]|nr:hypothetical protein [Opitutaceae bacterium]
MRRTHSIVLALSGALATGLGVVGCSRPATDSAAWDTNDLQDNTRDQQNNAYVPGVGYYHTPFHAWYAYPFNYYFPGRGYFYGGFWHPAAFAGVIPPMSRPSPAGWMRARAAVRGLPRSDRESAPSGLGFAGHGGGFHGSSGGHAAPASHGVIRGGFGHIGAGHVGA